MPVYRFRYLDPSGTVREGRIEAEDPEAALLALRENNILPLEDLTLEREVRQKTLPAQLLAAFFRQMSSLLRTGKISPPQALELLEDTIPKKHRARYLLAYQQAVAGEPLARSLASTGLFPRLVIALLEIGEKTGKLDEVLGLLYQHYTKVASFQRKLKGALTYPTFIVVLTFLLTWALMVFVVPQFASILEEMDAKMPLLTQIVVGTSRFLSSLLGLALTGLSVFAGIQAIRYIWSRPDYRKVLEPRLLRLPIAGPLLRYSTLASIASTFALMHRAGIHTYEILDYIRRSLSLLTYQDALAAARREIATQGVQVHQALSAYPDLFPKLFLIMIRIGEDTGQLDGMLEHSASSYEEEAEAILSGLSSVIEPILLVFVGGIVGLIMLSVLLPYFAIAQQISTGP